MAEYTSWATTANFEAEAVRCQANGTSGALLTANLSVAAATLELEKLHADPELVRACLTRSEVENTALQSSNKELAGALSSARDTHELVLSEPADNVMATDMQAAALGKLADQHERSLGVLVDCA